RRHRDEKRCLTRFFGALGEQAGTSALDSIARSKLRLRRLAQRQPHAELASAPDAVARRADGPAMQLGDLPDQRQAETRAFAGGLTRPDQTVEEPRQHRRIDADAVVRDDDLRIVPDLL